MVAVPVMSIVGVVGEGPREWHALMERVTASSVRLQALSHQTRRQPGQGKLTPFHQCTTVAMPKRKSNERGCVSLTNGDGS